MLLHSVMKLVTRAFSHWQFFQMSALAKLLGFDRPAPTTAAWPGPQPGVSPLLARRHLHILVAKRRHWRRSSCPAEP